MESEEVIFYHKDIIQTRFSDIDGLGHVNNSIIQEYFDIGRLGYFNHVFSNDVNWNEFGAIVASVKTDFIKPLFLKDHLFVKSKVLSIGNKSLNLLQQIIDDQEVVRVVSNSVMVGYDPVKKESKVIPYDWRMLIGKLENKSFL